ncbi:pantothenate synthetase [Verticillium alfalfae VaMs.102]|uniref:Pantoate--beta-alanine ligase n=1 Tax=Verticillium alfalfae (strain VaMs.102 / ATCC MYA-4576 / FGSC 10136) TaxID=526221 RepID=C9STV2_VERA1|nr:pantothenate synthetase [Verticillium alfalfae VaMs.102]EEY22263.1 pantothenate synthetase [Verticillium alfalfae VaMs.102]
MVEVQMQAAEGGERTRDHSPLSRHRECKLCSVGGTRLAAALAKNVFSHAISVWTPVISHILLRKSPNSSIRVLRTVAALRAHTAPLTRDHRTLSLVPTMGALHAGHLALIRAAALASHNVIVSLYVNPAQFGPKEDLASYPRTWDADAAALARLSRSLADDPDVLGKISAVFAPSTEELYPGGFPGQDVDSPGSFVTITPLAARLEGSSRPTFFRGVATVCAKLFNAVQPQQVYFGQKDVQQTVVIRRLVRDFLFPTEVVVVPTVREPDGLALSSRNVYLGERRRAAATVLHRALQAAEDAYGGGELEAGAVLAAARTVTDKVTAEQAALAAEDRVRFEVDYISLTDPDTMEDIDAIDPARGAILCGAVKMLPVEAPREGEDLGLSGGPAVRLIDNIILSPKAS